MARWMLCTTASLPGCWEPWLKPSCHVAVQQILGMIGPRIDFAQTWGFQHVPSMAMQHFWRTFAFLSCCCILGPYCDLPNSALWCPCESDVLWVAFFWGSEVGGFELGIFWRHELHVATWDEEILDWLVESFLKHFFQPNSAIRPCSDEYSTCRLSQASSTNEGKVEITGSRRWYTCHSVTKHRWNGKSRAGFSWLNHQIITV